MIRPVIRRIIRFAPQAYAWLEKESRRLGITVTELVRRAVDEYRERHERKQ